MSGLVGQVGARSGIVGSTTDSTQLEYEEGTFDVAHGLIYTTTGSYTKIGNTVFIRCPIKTGTIGGLVEFSFNLPFTSASDSGGMAVGITDRDDRISMTIASSANSVTCKSMDACVNNDFYGFALQYTV